MIPAGNSRTATAAGPALDSRSRRPGEQGARGTGPDPADSCEAPEPAPHTLEVHPDGSLVRLDPADWFVCFVPGIERQWWHPFVHERHKHVFAMRPAGDGKWTLFEPWWTRLLTATITDEQARKFLRWGALGDVLLVREAVPGRGSQLRGWMNCAALAAYLLGRPYRVWTPHALYKRLLREPNVCRVDVSELLERDLSELGQGGSRTVPACAECRSDDPKPRPGARKPFCMNCGRDLVELPQPDRRS